MPFNFFGKGNKAPTTEEAINKLAETEAMLSKKSEFIEKQMNEEVKKAKAYGTKNKRAALQCLKKKHRLEKQLEQVDNTLTTIEFQRESLMSAKSNAEVLTTMKTAAGAMKKIHKDQDIDNVEDVMADIQEQQDIGQEIADAISRPIEIAGMDQDEDDLMAELEELEQEEVDLAMTSTNMAGLPSIPTPSVPTHVPAQPVQQTAQEEDDGLDELQQWMASWDFFKNVFFSAQRMLKFSCQKRVSVSVHTCVDNCVVQIYNYKIF